MALRQPKILSILLVSDKGELLDYGVPGEDGALTFPPWTGPAVTVTHALVHLEGMDEYETVEIRDRYAGGHGLAISAGTSINLNINVSL